MQQTGMWCHGDQMPRLPRSPAEFDIIVCHWPRPVEAVQLLEQGPADHQASAADSRYAPRLRRSFLLPPTDVLPDAVCPAKHAGVLDAAVGVEERRTDNPDTRLPGRADHFLEPVGVQSTGIVIEKDEPVSRRHLRPGV